MTDLMTLYRMWGPLKGSFLPSPSSTCMKVTSCCLCRFDCQPQDFHVSNLIINGWILILCGLTFQHFLKKMISYISQIGAHVCWREHLWSKWQLIIIWHSRGICVLTERCMALFTRCGHPSLLNGLPRLTLLLPCTHPPSDPSPTSPHPSPSRWCRAPPSLPSLKR